MSRRVLLVCLRSPSLESPSGDCELTFPTHISNLLRPAAPSTDSSSHSPPRPSCLHPSANAKSSLISTHSRCRCPMSWYPIGRNSLSISATSGRRRKSKSWPSDKAESKLHRYSSKRDTPTPTTSPAIPMSRCSPKPPFRYAYNWAIQVSAPAITPRWRETKPLPPPTKSSEHSPATRKFCFCSPVSVAEWAPVAHRSSRESHTVWALSQLPW